jgi:hypothetical protein
MRVDPCPTYIGWALRGAVQQRSLSAGRHTSPHGAQGVPTPMRPGSHAQPSGIRNVSTPSTGRGLTFSLSGTQLRETVR